MTGLVRDIAAAWLIAVRSVLEPALAPLVLIAGALTPARHRPARHPRRRAGPEQECTMTDTTDRRQSLTVYAGHLCIEVDRHTCGAGGEMPHEPGCGLDPIATVDEVLAALARDTATRPMLSAGAAPATRCRCDHRADQHDGVGACRRRSCGCRALRP